MQYVYGARSRVFPIDCQTVADFIERIEDKSDTFYDILIFGRKLSEAEVKDYELQFLGKIQECT